MSVRVRFAPSPTGSLHLGNALTHVQLADDAAPPTAATVYTSLWQDNLSGIRVERFINWKLLPGAVQFTATLT